MTLSPDPLVWLVNADAVDEASLDFHAALLGSSERARCAHFLRPERRRQFIIGRTLLRRMLGRLLAIDPATILLEERAGQSPELMFPREFLGGFSISHSGCWVACAASIHTGLGIDIERVDPERDVLALAEQAFGPVDLAFLRACTPAERHSNFYQLWCQHEARFKLGTFSAMDYVLQWPGLAGVLACAKPLCAAPSLVQVHLDTC